MAKEAKLKVKLLSFTKDPEQNVVAAIRQCYAAVGALELKKKTNKETKERLIRQILESGHTSTIEHASFTFAIEGISRACSHQLVRHRLASYSMQSQRYVDLSKKGMLYIVPPQIGSDKKLKKLYQQKMGELESSYKLMIDAGVKAEDARFLLPNSCETKLVVSMNARGLDNFFRQRLCTRSQWEIRRLAEEMYRLVKKVAPLLFQNSGPTCLTEKICWEGNLSCGKWKNVIGGQLKSRI